jgi:hypothetical protein
MRYALAALVVGMPFLAVADVIIHPMSRVTTCVEMVDGAASATRLGERALEKLGEVESPGAWAESLTVSARTDGTDVAKDWARLVSVRDMFRRIRPSIKDNLHLSLRKAEGSWRFGMAQCKESEVEVGAGDARPTATTCPVRGRQFSGMQGGLRRSIVLVQARTIDFSEPKHCDA